jgi:hypothetical protein
LFTPGYLSAAGAALLNEMARQYQANGFRIGVTSWPLTVSRPGRLQGTIIGIDPGAFPPGFFFAEILGSAAAYPSGGSGTDADDRAYSWVERVQDVAGVWKDGTRFGEFNAYAAESETGFPGEVAAGTMVMMRASSSVAGTWEFLPAASGSSVPEYWYAQLTSGTSPYSWVERVETSAGAWANGSRTGTSNAYQCQPSAGTPSTPATTDIVLMRASATVSGNYEFILADKAGDAQTTFLANTTAVSNTVYTSLMTLTAAQTGTYLVGYAGTFSATSAGNLFTTFAVNGVAPSGFAQFVSLMAAATVQTFGFTRMLNLTAGDTVSLLAFYNLTGTTALGANDLWTTRMWMARQ